MHVDDTGGHILAGAVDLEGAGRDWSIRAANRLDDAIRGILDAGGDTSVRWTALQTLAAGDRAIGGSVLTQLYRQHAERAVPVDLDALFLRLGVSWRNGEVVLDDTAEQAPLRRALTAPRTVSAASPEQAQGQSGLASPGVPKSPL